ncbi:MAG: PilZ domain-containing protein [Desulfuromonadaceae bacterium]|nr:PilZ domain-containing protein [Desulfuromonadaceae bacterium]
MNEQKSPYYTRQYDRKEVLVEARIMDDEGWHDCLIINISVSGAKLRIGFQFSQGDTVRLQIGNFGEFGGVVTWQNSQEIGVKFIHDPSELADVVMGLAMYG